MASVSARLLRAKRKAKVVALKQRRNAQIAQLKNARQQKLNSIAANRRAAIARMTTALQEIVVDGISTNIPLHQEIFQHAAFKAGGTDIHYLERRLGLK